MPGTYSVDGGGVSSEHWQDTLTGAHVINLQNVYFGFTGTAWFELKDVGTEASHDLYMQHAAFGTPPGIGSTVNATNISTKWATWQSLNAPIGRIGTVVWPASSGSAQVTLTSGEVITWWRSGNNLQMKISW